MESKKNKEPKEKKKIKNEKKKEENKDDDDDVQIVVPKKEKEKKNKKKEENKKTTFLLSSCLCGEGRTKRKRIFHISDIHIRLNSRKIEYEYIFQQVYDFLATNANDKEDVLVITGDILHSKIELQPECIFMTLEFLKKLGHYLPTFLIAGNHDALLNNKERMDSLTIILHDRKIPNVYYLKYSGYYYFDNIVFVVNSLLEKEEKEWIMTTEENRTFIDDDNNQKCNCDKIQGHYQIGLYHGALRGWTNNDGYENREEKIGIEWFEGLDFVLLGDIHKYQYMNKKKTIAYAGSLISQNFGETDLYHGILQWDLKEKTSQYHILTNPYGYEKILVYSLPPQQQTLLSDKKDWIFVHTHQEKKSKNYSEWKYENDDDFIVCRKGNICVCFDEEDISVTERHELSIFLKHKYPQARIHWKMKKIEKNNLSAAIPNFLLPENQKQHPSSRSCSNEDLEIIDSFFSSRQDTKISKIQDIDIIKDEIKKIWTSYQEKRHEFWEIKKLTFQNLFGYRGDINVIDCQRLRDKNIIGIFGNNSSGKSSLLDIITFLFYNKISRHPGNSIPKEIVNYQEKKGFGEICFLLGGREFLLRKELERTKQGKIKIKEFLYEWIDGKKFELTEEQRRKTDQKLFEWIGDYKTFLFSNIFLQQGEIPFREMKPIAKKEFLYHLFGLDRLEHFRKEKEEEWKELKIKCAYKKEEMGEKTPQYWHSSTEQLRSDISRQESILETLKYDSSLLFREQEELHSQIKPCLFDNEEQINKKRCEIENIQEENTHLQENSHFFKIYSLRLQDPNFENKLLQKFSPIHFNKCSRKEFDKVYIEKNNIMKESSILLQSWSLVNQEYEMISQQVEEMKKKIKHYIPEPRNDKKRTEEQIKMELESLSTEIDSIRIHHLLSIVLEDPFQELWQQIEKECNAIEVLESSLYFFIEQHQQDKNTIYNPSCEACMTNPRYLSQKELERECEKKKKHLQVKKEACFQMFYSLQKKLYSSFSPLFQEDDDKNEKKEQECHFHDTSTTTTISTTYKQIKKGLWCIHTMSLRENYSFVKELCKTQNKLFCRLQSLLRKKAALETELYSILLHQDYLEYKNIVKKHQEKKQKWSILKQKYEDFLSVSPCINTYEHIRELWNLFPENQAQSMKQFLTKYFSSSLSSFDNSDDEDKFMSFFQEKKNITEQEISETCHFVKFQLQELQHAEEIVRWNSPRYERLKQIKPLLEKLASTIQDTTIQISIMKKELEYQSIQQQKFMFLWDEWKKMEKEKELASAFLSIIDKNGLPLFFLQQKTLKIQEYVNHLLSFFLDKKLIFQLRDHDIEIGFETTDPFGNISCSSFLGGMENFVADLCIKLSFSYFASYPYCNLFFIDEGISVFDQEKIQNIQVIFNFLINIRQHVFIISHLPTIQDFVHQSIYVEKRGQDSKLIFR